jgi:hypothetical protein
MRTGRFVGIVDASGYGRRVFASRRPLCHVGVAEPVDSVTSVARREVAFGNTRPLLDDLRRVRSRRGEEFDVRQVSP